MGKKKKKKKHKKLFVPRLSNKPFYKTVEWQKVRYQALLRSKGTCEACGRSPEQGAVLNVDHIVPIKYFPGKALDLENTQVLCGACNHGKGNWDQTNWKSLRTKSSEEIHGAFLRCDSCYEIVPWMDSCGKCEEPIFLEGKVCVVIH